MNNYPIVLVHGMYGFGEDEGLYKILPYYGMITGSLVKRLREQGYRAVAPKVGSVASAWDRACELYAILLGGTVDYGEAHSKRYGHERFGRTYEKGLIEDWGSLDENGKLVKIHMFGHSFGGATMRMFVELLESGSEEERKVSGENVSGLFAGGKGEWVCSITSLAGPHDGTTIMHAIPGAIPVLKAITYILANIIGNTGVRRGYDFGLEAWHLTTPRSSDVITAKMFDIPKIIHAARSKDSLFWDLRIDGAAEMNKNVSCHDTTYYFSVATLGTYFDENGKVRKGKIMNPILWIPGYAMSRYKPSRKFARLVNFDDSWLLSDGLATYGSSKHPKNEPWVTYEKGMDVKKGIWHVMPDAESDHGTIIGGSTKYIGFGKKKIFDAFYLEHIDLLKTLD
ncbi:MAG: hypothetical protein PUD72_05755 [Oscillospiraceae bacterium]|nr:hypothetical protein [Oscillospiraceae bacterium]